jgi:NAD(P)-dependent dehydrogenase (short-subunit alcohol dehydrogenase family)
MNSFNLEGTVSIVTGAAGLLGREHCRALAEAGSTVVAADLDANVAESHAHELGLASAIGLDVTNPGSVASMCEVVMQQYGRIDVFVNNAAVNDMVENPALAAELSRFENYPLSLWKRVMDVNVTGVFLCCQHVAPIMAEQGRGSIINIASTYGVVAPDQSIYRTPDGQQPFYKSAAYPTSKGAVVMLTKFLATYYGNKGVRVNALSPGGVENGQADHFVANYSAKTPLGRMARPTDYRGALVFLASEASAYVTGLNLLVDGGWTAW